MSKEKISEAEVKNAAGLAMLEFSKEETQKFRSYLANILLYMENLSDLDTDGIEPASHALDVSARMRNDEASPADDSATEGAPQSSEGFFSVPRVIEG